jgi:hypothetical protein
MARFVVSHRLAGKQSQNERDASLSALTEAGNQLRSFASILTESQPKAQGRAVIFIEADSKDVEAQRAGMSPDLIIEPEVPRLSARYFPMIAAGLVPVAAETGAAGSGAVLELTITSASGTPTRAIVNVVIANAVAGRSTLLTTDRLRSLTIRTRPIRLRQRSYRKPASGPGCNPIRRVE